MQILQNEMEVVGYHYGIPGIYYLAKTDWLSSCHSSPPKDISYKRTKTKKKKTVQPKFWVEIDSQTYRKKKNTRVKWVSNRITRRVQGGNFKAE